MKRGILIGLIMALAAGCVGQGFIAPGGTAYQWTSIGTKDVPGLGVEHSATFVTAKCPYGKNCTTVSVGDAGGSGQEAYSFVFKLKHRALIGIPYGEEPITVYVVGDRAECLYHSAFNNVRKDGRVNEGSGRLSADPAERCAGPVWIR
jgi:hypothetical protein